MRSLPNTTPIQKDVSEYKYLIGTRHVDPESGLTYETTEIKVAPNKDIIVWRKRVYNGKLDKNSQGPFYAEEIHLYTQLTLRRGLPKRGKHHKTTCDVPAVNMSKLSAAQEVVIDSSRSEEDVPTNEEIVSCSLGSADNTSIGKAQYLIEILYFLMGIVLLSFLMGNGLILPWTLQIQWKSS